MIPYSRQSISEGDIEAVVKVLRGDLLTQGPVLAKFESAVANYCGAQHAVATVNASAALHVALMLLNVTKEDIVWVPAISFVATANCARYCDAKVEFVDVEADTGLISVDDLSERLKFAERVGRLPKVLIVVHIAGQSVDMVAVSELCAAYNIRLVEDAAHALGGEYKGRRVGSCSYSDITVFSFHPVKPVTSAEGGMLTFNHSSLESRARRLIGHGIERDASKHIWANESFWYYEQQELGYNYRLSEMHSALGLSQLSRLDDFLIEREQIACEYDSQLSGSNVRSLARRSECRHSWHLYIVQCRDKRHRDKLMEILREEGFGLNVHYLPIPSHPYYRALGARLSDFPNAQRYADLSISLPLFPGLLCSDLDTVELCRQFALDEA